MGEGMNVEQTTVYCQKVNSTTEQILPLRIINSKAGKEG